MPEREQKMGLIRARLSWVQMVCSLSKQEFAKGNDKRVRRMVLFTLALIFMIQGLKLSYNIDSWNLVPLTIVSWHLAFHKKYDSCDFKLKKCRH